MTRSAMGGVLRVTEQMCAKFEPLIPPRVSTHKFGGGRPPTSDRDCLDAIFFRLRTGCQWKALSTTGICAGSTTWASTRTSEAGARRPANSNSTPEPRPVVGWWSVTTVGSTDTERS